jgi:biotin operon repressor
MGTKGELRRVEDRLIKDLEETTIPFLRLGKKYGVSRQAIFAFCNRRGIKRPKREHTEKCSICQGLIRIAKKPHSDFISSQTIKNRLGLGKVDFRYHIGILRKKGLISQKFGGLHPRNKIPDDILKEIFPRRLKRRNINRKVYDKLKNMILLGKLKNAQKLVEEKLAHSLNVSRQPVHAGLLQLRKDRLVIWKHRKGTFVSFGP